MSFAILYAEPCGTFSWSFDVYDGRELVTTIDTAWLRERGDYYADGTDWQVRKLGLFFGHFVLETDGQVVAEAKKEGPLSRSFDVYYRGETMRLSAARMLSRRFELWRDGWAGEVVPKHLFSRKLAAEFPDDLPLHFRLFLVFLVLVIWRREQRAK